MSATWFWAANLGAKLTVTVPTIRYREIIVMTSEAIDVVWDMETNAPCLSG